MTELVLVGNAELLGRMPTLVRAERSCSADVIEYLVEIDRRRIFLDVACSSLSSYCMERLGYSEDEAAVRVRVARVASRFRQVLEELRGGRIHLSGLGALAQYLTPDNAEELLAEARGKTKRQIDEIIARRFPKPDVIARVTREAEQLPVPELRDSAQSASGSASQSSVPSSGAESIRSGPGTNLATQNGAGRVQPLSASRWSVQFTAGEQLQQKIERAKELLSHALPSGDLAGLFERALDALIEKETKRRFGADKPRRRRKTAPDSRHIPVDVAREVWERDGGQCTIFDELGRRCSARKFVTYEHLQPFALAGAPTLENLCLRCQAHNLHAARAVFGEETIEAKCRARRSAQRDAREQVQPEQVQREQAHPEQTQPRQTPGEPPPSEGGASAGHEPASIHAKAHAALWTMGFRAAHVRTVLSALRARRTDEELEATLRAALALLVSNGEPATWSQK